MREQQENAKQTAMNPDITNVTMANVKGAIEVAIPEDLGKRFTHAEIYSHRDNIKAKQIAPKGLISSLFRTFHHQFSFNALMGFRL